jgi:anti-sigma B factor antagonist
MTIVPIDTTQPAGGITYAVGAWSMWGEIDWSVLARIQDEALRHLAGVRGRLTIDLARVTFMDSAGLRLLARANDAAGPVRLTGLGAGVRDTLELSGLLGLFDIDDEPSRLGQRWPA